MQHVIQAFHCGCALPDGKHYCDREQPCASHCAAAGGDKWRGLQTPYIYDAYRGLRARGLQGFFTWSLEDSSHRSPPFDIEATLQQLS